MEPPLHPLLAPLSNLLGTWSGRGEGGFPTTEPFTYDETVTFSHVGKPFFTYVQRTRSTTDGTPMHTETGFWRVTGDNRVEIVVAHAFGSTEITEGTFSNGEIQLRSTLVAGTSTAKSIESIERDITVTADQFDYEIRMAAVGLPMTHHLRATLNRVED